MKQNKISTSFYERCMYVHCTLVTVSAHQTQVNSSIVIDFYLVSEPYVLRLDCECTFSLLSSVPRLPK